MPLYAIHFGTSQLEQEFPDDDSAIARALELRETAGAAGLELWVGKWSDAGWWTLRLLPPVEERLPARLRQRQVQHLDPPGAEG